MFSTSSQKNRIIFAFACVYLCWGSTYSAIRIAGLHLAPPLVGATRSLISTVLIGAIALVRGRSMRVPARTAWRLVLVGILLMTVNNLLLIWGETKVASGLASLIIAMVPIFVALLETGLPNGETLNRRGWIGTLLGILGMAVLLWPTLHRSRTAPGSDPRSLLGFAILVAAAFAFASGSILQRRFQFRVDPFVATAWQLGAAGIANLAIATAGGTLHTAHWTRSGLLAIAYLSVVGSVIGLTAYTYLLQHVPVTKVSTYAFGNPVVAVIIGILWFGERLSPSEIAGSMLILAAVATVILSRTQPSSPPPDPMPAIPIKD
jgi:drug/metabolite transporter (DMT)-like permease